MAQSTNVNLLLPLMRVINIWPLSSTDTPEKNCKMWFRFQIAAMYLLMAELGSILILTVYALHNKDRRVGSLLMSLFSGRSAWRQYADAVCGDREVNVPYNGICDRQTWSYVAYFYLCTLLVHGDKNGVLVFHFYLGYAHMPGVLIVVKCDLMKMEMLVIRAVTRGEA
ncbi:LOW QUALITY PROTEIN: hypothetical protein CVT25_015775 [Psilocybe cyanescens]|uniref:Uncharacterized protein n=1 Tax=Psilocybe cyanescens TaxID=93625 RepID=A0A409XG44_PSICY|nr:LOW QUALITY PROTEIN: hypothetical protein CVT25_015775 [Psilocybe cyanescens]